MAFDPNIGEHLTQLTLTTAQQNQQANAIMDRNLVGNVGAALTTGVQMIAAASLKAQTSLDPMEAAAAANIRSSQDPSHMAGLRTAIHVPTKDS